MTTTTTTNEAQLHRNLRDELDRIRGRKPSRTTLLTIGAYGSGMSPFDPNGEDAVERFVWVLSRKACVVVTDNQHDRPYNHHVSGVGVGHDDAAWAESRFTEGSMAAYYENDDPFGGRRIAGLK